MSAGQTTQTFFSWQGTKSTVGTWTRGVDSAFFGMGYFWNGAGGLNDEANWDVWLDAGTWKIASVHQTRPDAAIVTWQFNGVSQGTMDFYVASQVDNVYTELTGLSVATAQVVTLKALAASKNASSTSYVQLHNSIALIRTAGANTTGGSDTPGYTVEIIPWAGSKATVGAWTRIQSSARLGGGIWANASGINNSSSWDIYLDTGTFKVATILFNGPQEGIHTLQLGGVSKGTVDAYQAGNVENVYAEVTGIVVTAGVTTFTDVTLTKNGASGTYGQDINALSWVRTGA